MPLLLFVSIALLLPPSEALEHSEAISIQSDRDDSWRSDLDFLVQEARRVHADPERPAFSPRFEAQAQELREAIPELSNDQILTRMMRLLAFLNDGHTAVYGPGPDTKLEFERRVLPLKFYSFPGGLYIVDGTGEGADHAGSRVLRFGELSAEEVLRRMSEYRGVDNEMTWTWMGPQFYVRQLVMLREVGATTDGGSVELTLLTPEGEERTLTMEGGDYELVRKLRPFPAGFGEVPLYLSNVDANYWTKSMPDCGTIYFQFNQVRDAPLESIATFSTHLRTALMDEGAATLIVDVRHNNGGNNGLVRPLIRTLIEFEMRSPEHRIYVLMGRNTFSAAQNFINRVERWTNATFVGEPSSSSPNFVGEENEFVLPNSRVRGSISNRYWQDSDPGDDRPWIVPDMPVVLTAEEYFEGIDPVLDGVLEQVRSEKRF
jgi:hypothetical protein